MYFDGSDVELSGEDVNAAALDANGDIHLSTTNAFAVTGVSGDDEDVFTFMPSQLGANTAGTYASTLLFDGSQFGLAANDIRGMDITDKDITAGVTISESGGTTNVTEGGATDSYTVVLNTVPTDNVNVTVTPDSQTDLAPRRDGHRVDLYTSQCVDSATGERNGLGRRGLRGSAHQHDHARGRQ